MTTLQPKPCPFCGVTPKVSTAKLGDATEVACVNMECKPDVRCVASTRQKAVERWNERRGT